MAGGTPGGDIMKHWMALCVMLWVFPLSGQEKIQQFQSEIIIRPSGALKVTETITVLASGIAIKRGIYRDFPTKYKDRFGNRVTVDFKVLQVLRNGKEEPYFLRKRSNGVRLYIGRKDYFLPHGSHTYTLTYETNRQLGFFEDHDELYWNVTGNGWVFPIYQVEAVVFLPTGIPMDRLQIAGFTGPRGAYGKDFTAEKHDGGSVVFYTTRPLRRYEGLSIVIGWPKGFVHEPTRVEKMGYFLQDNLLQLLEVSLVLLVFFYYLFFWYKVGRDPKEGMIIPRYKPPDDLPPYALRYIEKMGLDNRGFTACILYLAVKGALRIEEKDKTYILHIEEAPSQPLREEEKEVLHKLFTGTASFTLSKSHYAKLQSAQEALKKALEKHYENRFFKKHTRYYFPGCLFSCFLLVIMMIHLFTAPTWLVGITLAILVGINILFGMLMPAPTKMGRRMLDKIEGFKHFLRVAEEMELQRFYPEGKTPELFEKFLPYAYALGLEIAWARQFEKTFRNLEAQGHTYQPTWYHGTHFSSMDIAGFSSGMGHALSSAISSALTPPGSSSGFSGGGGGGGW